MKLDTITYDDKTLTLYYNIERGEPGVNYDYDLAGRPPISDTINVIEISENGVDVTDEYINRPEFQQHIDQLLT